jgi:hypothetical protein
MTESIKTSDVQRVGLHFTLHERLGPLGDAVWTAIAAGVLVTVNAVLAYVLASVLLFVSLGPIILQYIERPLAASSSPRATIIGNGVALLVGYAALAMFGLLDHSSILIEGVTTARIGAAVFALAVTGGVLALANAVHAPAGSTTLFVAFGLMRQPIELAIVFGGVVIVCVTAFILNHIARIPSPLWRRLEPVRPVEPAQEATV